MKEFSLWALLILGQALNAGNMNYQQSHGYYEINSLMYSRHPSKEEIYFTKAAETVAIWGATKLFPKHKVKILAMSNAVVWGFITYDLNQGIAFKFEY